jgi:hypothetical protein
MVKFDYSGHELPTLAQREVLELIAEECAEVTQRVIKILRFGLEEAQANQPLTNKQRLALELGDLLEVLAKANELGCIDEYIVEFGRSVKREKLKQYLRYQEEIPS